jgi:hypothetical protein
MPISTRKINLSNVKKKVDGRSLTRTNRTIHFATKVTPEFDNTVRQLAQQKGRLITEMLEEILTVYLEQEAKQNKNKAKKKKRVL